MFTEPEMESRRKTVRKILDTDQLKALILIGNTALGNGFCGDLRYYTNHRVIFDRQVAVVFADSEPVLLLGSNGAQKLSAAGRSMIEDCRVANNLMTDVADLLKARGVADGRVGVSFEILPASWHIYFTEALPQVEWVETHARVMQARFQRSEEEAEIFRKGAALADGSFRAAAEFIRPGVSEYEIAAVIEHFARAYGAEESFTLITSGSFALGDGNRLPGLHTPSSRRIEAGDTVEFEITPRYEGYWTQLVRRINVVTPNQDLENIIAACCDALQQGLEHLKPGKAVSDVVSAIITAAENSGYHTGPGVGHICGIDLVESRLNGQNNMVLTTGTALIIHPRLTTQDGKSNGFWGGTYLVTPDGYERLNQIGDDVLIV